VRQHLTGSPAAAAGGGRVAIREFSIFNHLTFDTY